MSLRSRGTVMSTIGSHRLAAAGLLALLAVALMPTAALAHERRTVGGYDFVVGFAVEPALEGEKNGLDLRITKAGANIEGADKTLKFDVTQVQNKGTKTYPVRAVFGSPGRYTADFIPTLSGQYRFRIYGDIAGTPIDATFESSANTFSDVQPVADLQFPIKAAQPRELEGALRTTTEDARTASDAAKSARTLAIAGIAIGVIGLAVGVSALAMARGKRS